jgi:hypothetical protein
MSTACSDEEFFVCGTNKTTEEAIRELFTRDENGCTALRISGGTGGGGGGDASEATLQQVQTNTATAATSLGVLDDWDESDRAKVNPVVGQAGVQGGSGTVSANTQRVVLATDVALPAGTNTIGSTVPVATSVTTGQPLIFRTLAANSTAVAVKATSGNVYGWNIINFSATVIYVKIYDKAAASVNPAADIPLWVIEVPVGSVVDRAPTALPCAAAISVRAVTGGGDTDTTAPGTLPLIQFNYA